MVQRFRLRALALLVAALAVTSASASDTDVRPPKFDYTMTSLANGLNVILL